MASQTGSTACVPLAQLWIIAVLSFYSVVSPRLLFVVFDHICLSFQFPVLLWMSLGFGNEVVFFATFPFIPALVFPCIVKMIERFSRQGYSHFHHPLQPVCSPPPPPPFVSGTNVEFWSCCAFEYAFFSENSFFFSSSS